MCVCLTHCVLEQKVYGMCVHNIKTEMKKAAGKAEMHLISGSIACLASILGEHSDLVVNGRKSDVQMLYR